MKEAVPTISVRPKKELYPKLVHLAATLDMSEGQLLMKCAAAIIEMVEGEACNVPMLVHRAIILGKHL